MDSSTQKLPPRCRQALRLLRSGALPVLIKLSVGALLIASPVSASGDAVRLHQRATAGKTITLADVAGLKGKQARQWADAVVARFKPKQRTRRVTLQRVREALSEKDVNWGRVQLTGFLRCEVKRKADAAKETGATSFIDVSNARLARSLTRASNGVTTANGVKAPDAPNRNKAHRVASNIQRSVRADQAATLRQRIRRVIQGMTEAPADALRIRFSKRDAKRIDRSTLGKRYEVEPRTASPLGRVPITVRQYENRRVTEQFTVSAIVERRFKALVATQTISRGSELHKDDLRFKRVWLTGDRQPIADPALIEGQRADGVLRKDQLIHPDDIKSPTLVKRGQLITVRCLTGGLVVRTVARAMDDGGKQDTIKVRNESSNETFSCTVTGPRRGVVNLSNRQAVKATR